MAHDSKLSGPLLDRIDMQILVEPLGSEELLGRDRAETSDTIRARVEKARAKQTERYGSTTLTNATVPKSLLDESLNLSHEGRARLKSAIQDSFLTGRGVTRVLRVARTIADLQDDSSVTPNAVVLALGLRLRGAEALA
jgi:magnesium chelatase family protein